MIYDYIHSIVTTLLIDIADIPMDYQPLIYLFELWGVFIFFKWSLVPLVSVLKALKSIGRDIFNGGKPIEWRDSWVRKQRRTTKDD